MQSCSSPVSQNSSSHLLSPDIYRRGHTQEYQWPLSSDTFLLAYHPAGSQSKEKMPGEVQELLMNILGFIDMKGRIDAGSGCVNML